MSNIIQEGGDIRITSTSLAEKGLIKFGASDYNEAETS